MDEPLTPMQELRIAFAELKRQVVFELAQRSWTVVWFRAWIHMGAKPKQMWPMARIVWRAVHTDWSEQ